MKLRELLAFDDIVIQCHDNPDADAVASGYGLLLYFQSQGKRARFIYGGAQPIQKSNLVLMVDRLGVPIQHVQQLDSPPELLLTVDCQYGERNVQRFDAATVAVIDHHKAKPEALPPLREVRDNYGSCSTIVWDMLEEEGFDAGDNQKLSTALYYGLFMDTGKMQELRHPKDKDLRDALEFCCSKGDLFQLQNSNLSLAELEIAGRAMETYSHCPEYRFAVSEAERCDPNILGIISDTLMEVDVVDACVAFCMLSGGAKLSVRSCVREVRADELAAYLAEGLGSGGGHPQKSGGFLKESLLLPVCEERYGPLEDLGSGVRKLLMDRMMAYFQEQADVFHNGSADVPDLSGEAVYRKKRLPIGYVRATDLYPAGTKVVVRMLEGDFTLTVREDTYFIIGVEAEVYKNDEAYFLSHNDPTSEPYRFQGEYAPTVHEAVQLAAPGADGGVRVRQKSIAGFAKTCVPKEGPRAYARQLTRRTKVFVSWSENYMLGEPGDWLVARVENPSDVYIVKRDIFPKTYESAT